MLSEIETSRYFIRTDGTGTENPKLMVFDERGNVISSSKLPGHHTEHLLTIFNGLPKAVQRSSGGLILVQPLQLVMIHSENPQTEVRVKVLFKELERNSQHRVISKKLIISSKTIPLSEIKDGFSYDNSRSQNFVVDMGLGIVPIHVLCTYTDSQGVTWSVFVRHDQIEKSLIDSTVTQISLYEAPQSLLRWIEPFAAKGEKDFQWAKRHVQKLIERGETIIPEALLAGAPVQVPSGQSFTELEHFLLKYISENVLTTQASYFVPAPEQSDSNSLLPLDENRD